MAGAKPAHLELFPQTFAGPTRELADARKLGKRTNY